MCAAVCTKSQERRRRNEIKEEKSCPWAREQCIISYTQYRYPFFLYNGSMRTHSTVILFFYTKPQIQTNQPKDHDTSFASKWCKKAATHRNGWMNSISCLDARFVSINHLPLSEISQMLFNFVRAAIWTIWIAAIRCMLLSIYFFVWWKKFDSRG